MENNLPIGWTEATFEDVCDYIQRGKSPMYVEWSEFPVLNQKAIRWNGIQAEHLKFIHPDQWNKWDEERFLKVNDIVWNSTGTGTIGRAAFIDEQEVRKAKVVDSHVTIVRANKNVASKYIFYWIKSPAIQNQIESLNTGSTNQIELSRARVIKTMIPLAPYNEQQRIVGKLDELMEKIDRNHARLERIPKILKRFRESILSAAVSGKLTEEWRERNINVVEYESGFGSNRFDFKRHDFPDSWKWDFLNNLGEHKLGKMLDGSKNKGEPTYYLRNISVRWFEFDLTNLSLIKATKEDKEKFDIRDGDVFICEGGEPGRAAVWNQGKNELIFQKAIHRIRLNQWVNPYWLLYNIKVDADNGSLQQLFTGSGIKHLTLKSLSKYPIPLPSIEEQKEVVRKVAQLLSLADKIESRYNTAKAQVDRLPQSLLAKAFNGELVPQDEIDEPASVLLERIQRTKTNKVKA